MTTIGQVGDIQQVLDLPPERLAAVIGSWPEPAILASGPGFGAAGRWSILAAYPRLVFEATDRAWAIRDDRGTFNSGRGDPLVELGRLVARFGLGHGPEAAGPDACPFQGGLIGFLGYDIAPLIERLPRKAPRDLRLPDVRMALYDTVVIVDHHRGKVSLRAWDLTGEGREAAERRCKLWRRALRDAVQNPRPVRRSRLGPAESNFDRPGYVRTVRRVLDYIAAGDVFQINLSQRFATTGVIEPLDLYLRLCVASPAPFSAFLRWRDMAVVSASPEWFYTTRGDLIVTRPIKGTRPRGADPDEDRRLADELAASPKDRAELTMIVDLERNDLGRICRFGTVRVVDALSVESFAQVHHLVATVEGRLRPEVEPVDVVRHAFPGGSITGAPKIRAMEIIDELEPSRRSLYTGAIGYLGRGGASGFNIAIRTILVEGDRETYQVGGGIVADSDAEAEYEETLHKGRALRAILEGREDTAVIWVRGEIVADDALRVSVLDRTFEHGLGLFETFRTWNGHATLLPRHLDRLRASARELGLPLDPAALPDEEAVRRLLRADGRTGDARLRITLSGGLSSEGGETLWMRSFPMAPSSFEEGIILGPAWAARADALAGHKTLNYWFNRLMFEDAQARGFDESVTITPDGNVWEGSRSNLFAVVDGDVLTPPGDGKVLPGIMRGLILERGPRLGFSVREATLGIMDPLFRPQEVFLTNSVRGVVPVRQWGDARFPAPGPITRRLWEAIRPWLESGGQTT